MTHTYINYTCKLTQTIDVIVSQMKVNRSRPVSKYIFILLLANAFYTETNPGPRAPKWPCGTCKKSVKWNPKRPSTSICCDNCETWFHIECQIRFNTYSKYCNFNTKMSFPHLK